VQTPRFCGQHFRAGAVDLSFLLSLPDLISWLIVGIVVKFSRYKNINTAPIRSEFRTYKNTIAMSIYFFRAAKKHAA